MGVVWGVSVKFLLVLIIMTGHSDLVWSAKSVKCPENDRCPPVIYGSALYIHDAAVVVALYSYWLGSGSWASNSKAKT